MSNAWVPPARDQTYCPTCEVDSIAEVEAYRKKCCRMCLRWAGLRLIDNLKDKNELLLAKQANEYRSTFISAIEQAIRQS